MLFFVDAQFLCEYQNHFPWNAVLYSRRKRQVCQEQFKQVTELLRHTWEIESEGKKAIQCIRYHLIGHQKPGTMENAIKDARKQCRDSA